ncbi:MAG: L-seryl-tRNA(Sec) selenium transferase [Candidatus Latescibacterota bacterium]|nr:MAG: L-seryl-tRNA(Sec) selenium transferase [Candidatus Latescibacterota bacterium]
MTQSDDKNGPDREGLRSIPPVDDLLGSPELAPLREQYPNFPWTYFVRNVLDEFRSGKHGKLRGGRSEVKSAILRKVTADVIELRDLGMRGVINATGVILNTNLGRAVLGEGVRDAVVSAMRHYVNLEVELEAGKRGPRAPAALELLRLAAGAESAMIVNNNAAAVYLVVSTFSPPGRVIVSRGELVEIGGSFRLPDILEKAAGDVVEIGTTNRTYIDDYAQVAKPGDVLLKVHSSNYEIRGFTHAPPITDLVALAAKKRCHVVYDLGSGSFFDFERAGISGEERVKDVVETGVGCVTMSGDKLLGGVQAGIIVGRAILLDQIRQNPLRRALRVDKITIAAVQALLREYLFGAHPDSDIPVLRQSTEPVENLRARARGIVDKIHLDDDQNLQIDIVDDVAAVGGGSFACEDVASVAVVLRCRSENKAVALAKSMRLRQRPVLTRIKGREVRLNLRSVMPYEDDEVVAILNAVVGENTRGG